MKKLPLLALFCVLSLSNQALFAQTDAQFTQYMFNQLYFNPAYAGSSGQTEFFFAHRTQWAAYDATFDDGGTPSTQVLSFNTYLPKFASGIGLHIVNDQIGALRNLEVQLSYAYHVKLSNASRLSIGVRGGIFTKIIDFDKYRFREENPRDPFDQDGREALLEPDLAAGIYYYSDKLYLGVSVNHLTNTEFNFGDTFNQEALPNNFYLTGGYSFDLGRNSRRSWVLTPSVLLKTEFNEFSVDAGALVEYDEKFWVGASFRNEESANFLVGVNIPRQVKRKNNRRRDDHNIRIGYSFDYVFNGQDAKQPTSHEITLSYAIPVPSPTGPAKVRSVRFRY